MLIKCDIFFSPMLHTSPPVATISDMDIPTWLRGVMEIRGYHGVRHTARELNKELEMQGVEERLDYSQIARWLHGETSPSLASCELLSLATGHPYRDLAIMARIGTRRDVRTVHNSDGRQAAGT